MRATLKEFVDVFMIVLEPETVAETATLARLAMNVTKAAPDINVRASETTGWRGHIVLRQRRATGRSDGQRESIPNVSELRQQ